MTVWGERVAPDSLAAQTDAGQEILGAVEAFREWAAQNGVAVDRFFTERTVDSTLTGDRKSVV